MVGDVGRDAVDEEAGGVEVGAFRRGEFAGRWGEGAFLRVVRWGGGRKGSMGKEVRTGWGGRCGSQHAGENGSPGG